MDKISNIKPKSIIASVIITEYCDYNNNSSIPYLCLVDREDKEYYYGTDIHYKDVFKVPKIRSVDADEENIKNTEQWN